MATHGNQRRVAYPTAADPYVCLTSVATGGTPSYEHGRISLHFPTPTLAADGATHLYVYGGRSSAGRVVFIAACAIPATRAAVDWMNRRFRAVDRGGNLPGVRHAARTGSGVSTMGCVIDGQCALEEITVTVSPTPVDNCNVAGCSTTGEGAEGGGGSGGGGSSGWENYGPASPLPEDSTEVDAGSCPSILDGKVVTALILVGASNHQFDFEGPLYKIPGTSPAHYSVKPTVSKDGQWMATEGWIEVGCFGIYTPSIDGKRLWVGEAWFAGRSDLHMIYGPQHPSF